MPDNLLHKGDVTNSLVGHLFDFCQIDEDIPMIILKTCPNKFTRDTSPLPSSCAYDNRSGVGM